MTQGRLQFRVMFFHACLNPFGQLPLLAFGKLFECRFDFSNRAHGGKIANRFPFAKSVFVVQRKVAKTPGRSVSLGVAVRTIRSLPAMNFCG